MPVPRAIVDSLESVLGVYFSDVRHRERAAFILADELVEMACKLRSRQEDYQFNMRCNFYQAWSNEHVSISPDGLGQRIHDNHHTRNTLQHESAAATVDDEHCADAILDAVAVIDHCWDSAEAEYKPWMRCGLRIIRLHSRHGNYAMRVEFEDEMRRRTWQSEDRSPRENEILIEVGRRSYWQLLLTQNQAQVEELLDELGVP